MEKSNESGKIYADKKIMSYIENPSILGETTHKEKYYDFVKNGSDVKPLGKGNLKGIRYKDGGGYRVSGTEDVIYFQYHPKDYSHHKDEYYKITSGVSGKKRYDMKGHIID